MQIQDALRLASVPAAMALSNAAMAAAVDQAALDKAFEELKVYDWGKDPNSVKPITEAVVAVHGDAAASKALEAKLAEIVKSSPQRDAKDFACRALMVIGTADSVPTLAALLTDKDNAHMARYALERIQAPEAAAALRDALGKTSGALKIGVIASIGARRDAAAAGALTALLADSDAKIASAAACALGDIGSLEAAKALTDFVKKAPEGVKTNAIDAALVAAEKLLGDGKKIDALAVYKTLSADEMPDAAKLAAKRGMLAVMGKKN